ncbi:MAG: hypothetical protein AB1762_03940 [Gemmatimonadota bacterium]
MFYLMGRLFGENSSEAAELSRTDAQWRKTILKLLRELDRYQRANIRTDGFHELLLAASLTAAHKAATEDDDIWPGVVEGLVRYALTLMGDWPDHHRRKKGRKAENHYDLGLRRSITYRQDTHQQFLTLYQAVESKSFGVSTPMWQLLSSYYEEFGYTKGERSRIDWFRKKYPEVYARIF